MLKLLILSILSSNIIFASSLKIHDKISNFSLTDQFDKIHTINNDVSTIIVCFQKETLELINDFLSTKDINFLEKTHSVFISNISSTPIIITKLFTIPKLRDYKYDILLIYDETNTKFSKQDNKITVYSILDGEINNINYLSTKNELENLLKQ
ncbi:hypothetical protein [Arcobacter sp. s6]|jgi:hypothetical protein|uniref:hypothetical protein n=1 Tax=Arcobacter sp. s6 TaxID=3230363 RepID=UPI0034A000AC